jgi:acyl CoA:acetate/3-ketoacid CoA transferase beta subunit
VGKAVEKGLVLRKIAWGLTVDEVVGDAEAQFIISENLKASDIL